MDIALLLSASKIVASIFFVLIAIALIVLAFRSLIILKALQVIDITIRAASVAILSQGSLIISTLIPILSKTNARSNIWTKLFHISPLAKNERIQKLIKPITNILESIVDLMRV
jgi:hypothetical protein